MTLADLQNKIYFYTHTDSTSFTNANMVIAINNAIERIEGLILENDSRWRFGDTNFSSLPTGTQDLTSGTQTYTFDSTLLNVLSVEIKDINGLWHQLKPITLEDIRKSGIAQQEYQKTAGFPLEYEKRENYIILYPPPSSTVVSTGASSAGLKVFFQRASTSFTSTNLATGTAVPGFASIFHELIALWPSYDFAIANALPNVGLLMGKIQLLEKRLAEFYGQRAEDDVPNMTMKSISYL